MKTDDSSSDDEAKSEEEEDALVLCLPVGLAMLAPVPGSMRKACADCGRAIWHSPASAAALAGRPHKLKCPECFGELPPDAEIARPTAGQLAEMPPDVAAEVIRQTRSAKARSKLLREALDAAKRGAKRRPRAN